MTKPAPSCTQTTRHGDTEVRGQRARVRPLLQGQDSRRGSEACLSDADSADPGGKAGPVDRRGDCSRNSGAGSRSA